MVKPCWDITYPLFLGPGIKTIVAMPGFLEPTTYRLFEWKEPEMNNPIKSHRQRLGLTQAELSLPLRVSPAAVAQWERSDLVPPEARLRALAALLGVGESDLLSGLSKFREYQRREATKKLEGALVA